MTDFQLGLAVVGAVAIAAVVLYNHLQERKARRRGEQSFPSRHADVLLEGEPARREPSFAPTAPGAQTAATAVAVPDPRIDYVIDAIFTQPVTAAAWIEKWRPFEMRSKQRLLVAGSAEGSVWEPVEADPKKAWSRYRAGMQLVSRTGMASEGELLEFRSMIEDIAAAFSGTVQRTDVRHAIEQAQQLDRFCADSDIQVAFHLVPAEADRFTVDAVREGAASVDLRGNPAAGYRLQDAHDETVFSVAAEMQVEGAIGRLTFSLDVPRVADVRRGYAQMVSCAQQLRGALGGTLVDDNSTLLDERALEAIGRSLEPVNDSLEKSGMAPGSPAALRLFS